MSACAAEAGVETESVALPAPRVGDGTPSTAPQFIGGRFRPRVVIKSARGVDTLLAFDEVTGEDVVLKTARTNAVATGARLRLEHEASVLEQIRGPGLVPPLACGEDAGLLYLALPLLP